MRSLLPGTGLALAALATIAFVLDGDFGIRDPSMVVLCNGKYCTHGAGGSSLVSDKGHDETGLFQVDVVTAPPAVGDFRAFTPDFGQCQVIVMNYDAADEWWPEPRKTAFESYVNGGGGLAVVHAADNAFPGGQAFNESGNHRNRREPWREIAL
ncbi:MAG: hypothetical protein ABSG03_30330 [Bryobacteraceae bacterium]|jgi:hypothetical protein